MVNDRYAAALKEKALRATEAQIKACVDEANARIHDGLPWRDLMVLLALLAMQVAAAGPLLTAIDRAALVFFTMELTLRLWAHRFAFFRGGWNLFDLAVVAVSWLPTAGAFSVLRALRVLRVLRLISVVPQMRAVVGALFRALPGMGAIAAVLGLVFYVAAVMATELFSATFPQWFGSVGASLFSLFQIMTLESWSMGIARPVMEVHPWAWMFFVPFVVVTSFTVLNLFIALIVNSMQAVQADEQQRSERVEGLAHDEREALLREVVALREELREMRSVNRPR